MPPEPPAHPCAACYRPTVWLWSGRTRTWVEFTTDPGDKDALRVHRCRTGRDLTDWRNLPTVPPEDIQRGAARAARELAEARARHDRPAHVRRHLSVVANDGTT